MRRISQRTVLVLTLILTILQNAINIAGEQIPLRDSHNHTSPLLDEEFSQWIEEIGKSWGMKGVAIAVVRKDSGDDGWVTETKGYGIADKWGNPVDEETLFSIGSNSKLFAALAVGMLTENVSIPITWHSKIKDILPSTVWGLQDKIAENHANVVDILSHRTGLPRHDLSYSRGDGVESTLSKLRYLRHSAEFRETFQYNNQMYMLASHIVARMANMPFVEFVTSNILSPLGLSFTTYNVTQAQESGKLADGFVDTGPDGRKGEGRRKARFRPIPYWNREGGREITAGPGGVISNARDLVTWLQALLLSGRSPVTGEVVIPETVVDRVARGVTIASPVAQIPELSPQVYGMGQWRYTYQGHELIEHNGGVIGQFSTITRVPHDGLGIAVLTNWDDGAKLMEVVKYRLLEKALGLPAVDWNDRLHKLEQEVGAHQTSFSPPANAHVAKVSIHALEGLYFNPAYGTLALCIHPPPSPYVSRPECATPLPDELRPLLNSSEPVLFASWPKVWSSHLLLRHEMGDRFTAVPADIYPAPFPPEGDRGDDDDDDKRPFAVAVGGVSWPAEFVILGDNDGHPRVEGMAWNGVWQAGLGVPSLEGGGKAGAEVWFDRVD